VHGDRRRHRWRHPAAEEVARAGAARPRRPARRRLGLAHRCLGAAEFATPAAENGDLTGGGNIAEAFVATVIPLVAIGARVGMSAIPTTTERRNIEQRSRSWIFATPALAFIASG
jgi:hypothetical protein